MEYYLTLTINHIYFRTLPLELITKPEMKMPANLPGKDLSDGWPNPWDSINHRKLTAYYAHQHHRWLKALRAG